MMNSIEDIIELHRHRGSIEDAYVKIHIDEKVLNLNVFTLKVTAIDAEKNDVEIWNEKIEKEIEKNKELEKEVKEFISLFELLNKLKIKSGEIIKTEKPDFIIKKENKVIGVEVTKIYVGYDWAIQKMEKELKEYKIPPEYAEGYLEHRRFADKIELYTDKGKLYISPKVLPKLNQEYQIMIKNKIFEKIRKQIDDYEECDNNIIYADITSPEYFEEIANLDGFLNEMINFVEHLEGNLKHAMYNLIIKINNKYIEFNLSERKYQII